MISKFQILSDNYRHTNDFARLILLEVLCILLILCCCHRGLLLSLDKRRSDDDLKELDEKNEIKEELASTFFSSQIIYIQIFSCNL